MTPDQKLKLRALAEDAKKSKRPLQGYDLAFVQQMTPTTILSLLDENDRLLKRVERLETEFKALLEDCDHYFALHGQDPKVSYTQGRHDTFKWIAERAREALGESE